MVLESKSGQSVVQTRMVATAMVPWRLLQVAAAEDTGTVVDLDTGYDLASQASNVIDLYKHFGNSWNQLVLSLYSAPFGGQDPVAGVDTFGFDLIGWRADSPESSAIDPPMLICSCSAGAGLIGNGAVANVTDAFWASTINLGGFSNWIGDVVSYDSGNDRIAKIVLDAVGLKYLLLHKHGVLGATSGEAPSLALAGSVF